jgi:hypothetical protein
LDEIVVSAPSARAWNSFHEIVAVRDGWRWLHCENFFERPKSRGTSTAVISGMMIAIILASWVGASVLFCLAIALAAARRAPKHDKMPVQVVEVAATPDTSFELEVAHKVIAPLPAAA